MADGLGMWSETSRTPAGDSPIRPVISLASSDPYLSVGNPFVKMRISTLPGKGYVITLTDPTQREVTSPTIPFESLSRALEGRTVTIRNGGFIGELFPTDGFIRIKVGPMAGLCLEGAFRPEDVEAAARSARERHMA